MKTSKLALRGANPRRGSAPEAPLCTAAPTHISTSSARYGAVAMILHWVIALLVVLDFALAMSFRYFNPGDRLYFASAYRMHMSLGMVVLVLSVACVLWRLAHRYPSLPPAMDVLLRVAAKTVHVLLYFFILAVPFIGWLVLSMRRSPAVLFGSLRWPNNDFLVGMSYAARKHYNDLLMPPHAILSYAGMCLVVLHVVAALHHHFIRHDDVLRRMLPAALTRPELSTHSTTPEAHLR
jgi:cytochrome b561